MHVTGSSAYDITYYTADVYALTASTEQRVEVFIDIGRTDVSAEDQSRYRPYFKGSQWF